MPILANNEPGTWKKFDIESSTSILKIEMIGSGASSQVGQSLDGLFSSSGSGGSAACFEKFVFLDSSQNATALNLYCAKGGSKDHLDGEDSKVQVLDANENVISEFVAQGGFAGGVDAQDICIPGNGGVNPEQPSLSGLTGEFGDCLPASFAIVRGKKGANSYYATGGRGALTFQDENGNSSLNPENGRLGSAAGSCCISSVPGNGGDGFVIVQL